MFRTLLIGLAVLLFAPHLIAQTTPGSLQGRVVNAQTSEPIGGASVSIFPIGHGDSRPLSVKSQPSGDFRFDEVPPGLWVLSVTHSDFAQEPGENNRPIRIDSGAQVLGMIIQLSPEATLAGKVLDETGAPIVGAQVSALVPFSQGGHMQLSPRQTATTGQKGDYTLTNLDPGRYYVVAQPPTETRTNSQAATPASAPSPGDAEAPRSMVRTLYPKALDLESATLVDVSRGASNSGIDIEMAKAATYHVRGKVALGLTAAHALHLALAVRDSLQTDVFGQDAKLIDDGSFDIAGVLPGDYTLWLLNATRAPVRGVSQAHILAREDITVDAADRNNVQLALMPPVNLTGKVSVENAEAPDLSGVRVNIVPIGPIALGVFQSVPVAPDGSFSIQNLEPGRYLVRAVSQLPGSYQKSVSLNRQDVTATGLDLSEGGSGELDIVLRVGLSAVDGSVEASSESVNGAATVVLIPDRPAADGSGVYLGGVNASNTFLIRNVPPGHYYALVVGRWNSIWQNQAFLLAMQSQGVSVDLPESGSAHVQVTVVSQEQIDQTAARLGLFVH